MVDESYMKTWELGALIMTCFPFNSLPFIKVRDPYDLILIVIEQGCPLVVMHCTFELSKMSEYEVS
jgi:hypothetical protein